MRILQLNSASTWGGGETHLAVLAAGLRARGHEVFLAGRGRGAFQGQTDLALPFRNAFDLYSALRLRRWLGQHACDIVHAHVARDYAPACMAMAGNGRARLVCTRHLLYPLRPNPLYGRIAGWIAPTAGIARTLEPLRPRVIRVIANGIDTAGYGFRPYRPQSPLRLGLLGQIAPHKGHEDALEALRHLGPGFGLRIAGAGEDAYLRQLRRRAEGLPVVWSGFTPAAAFLGGIDVLLAPSWEEPFGLVILEAMAAGVPVVATDAGGPAGIITAGVTGYLVPPRQPSALAAAIEALAADPEGTAALALRARALVEEHYDAGGMAERVEAFYRSVGAAAPGR